MKYLILLAALIFISSAHAENCTKINNPKGLPDLALCGDDIYRYEGKIQYRRPYVSSPHMPSTYGNGPLLTFNAKTSEKIQKTSLNNLCRALGHKGLYSHGLFQTSLSDFEIDVQPDALQLNDLSSTHYLNYVIVADLSCTQ